MNFISKGFRCCTRFSCITISSSNSNYCDLRSCSWINSSKCRNWSRTTCSQTNRSIWIGPWISSCTTRIYSRKCNSCSSCTTTQFLWSWLTKVSRWVNRDSKCFICPCTILPTISIHWSNRYSRTYRRRSCIYCCKWW